MTKSSIKNVNNDRNIQIQANLYTDSDGSASGGGSSLEWNVFPEVSSELIDILTTSTTPLLQPSLP